MCLPRHEAALRRFDGQHMSGEDHQPGEAHRDLQPGRSESRQGICEATTLTLMATLLSFVQPLAVMQMNQKQGFHFAALFPPVL